MKEPLIRILSDEWLHEKKLEKDAVERRRDIEDRMCKLIGIKETLEGTETTDIDGVSIKIVGRIDRKVDADKVQELAAEFGLTNHLETLFRWKPEINVAIWKSTDPAITKPLEGAITAKPGRPSFSITKE